MQRDQSDPRSPRETDASDEALRRLAQRLDRAADAAQRLVGEAAGRSARGARSERGADSGGEPPPQGAEGKPPPAGWQVPESAGGQPAGGRHAAGEIELLLGVVDSLRELIPPELQHRLAQALREVLLAVRALIDWYLERVEQAPAEPSEVQDIPIL